MIRTMDIEQNTYLGILLVTNDRMTLVPDHIDETDLSLIREVLQTEVSRCNLSGLALLGTLTAMNSRGLMVPALMNLLTEDIQTDFRIENALNTKLNAFGNNILVNDNFALVHKNYPRSVIKNIEDVFDVEVEKGTVANNITVGASAVVTNRGLLLHPMVESEERERLGECFKVPSDIGTANFGVPQVGACMVANSQGALTGSPTTGIELGQIEETLRLY